MIVQVRKIGEGLGVQMGAQGGKEPLQLLAPDPQLQYVLRAEEISCYADHSL